MKTLFKRCTVSVLAILAALLLALGFVCMRPVAFADTESTFKMEEGASVKYGAATDENGIRFTATLSKSEYETLTSGAKSVESGTFIMPAAYQKAYGAISEEACFGTNNTYYYKDADGVNVGKNDERNDQHEILNAVGTPRFLAEDNLYEINGSIVTILDANLNVPLIARSYIKVTSENDAATYYFAAMDADITKNVRSVVSVSQNALLKGVTGAEHDTVKGYFDKFIELNPDATAKYTETFSVVDLAGVKENAALTAEKTASVTKYNETVTATVPAGYKKVVAYEGTGSAILKLDGSTVLNTVIEKDNTERIIFDAENAGEFNATLIDNGIIATDKAATWSWDGTKSAYFKGDLAKGFGWKYETAKALPYATDAFSLTVKSDVDFTMNIAVSGMSSVSTVRTDGLATVEIKAGVNKIYFVLSQPMKTVEQFYAYATAATEGEFAIDYFSYENAISVNGSYGNLALDAKATSYDITALDSTVFGSENLTENVTVSYIELNDVADEDGTYTEVAKAADKYTIAVNAATSYIIKVKVTAANLEYEKRVYLIGDHGLLRESFEEGENSAVFTEQYDARSGKYCNAVSGDWSLDGYKSMSISSATGNYWWCGPKFDTALAATGSCNYVSFWLFTSSTAVHDNFKGAFQIYFNTDNGKFNATLPIKTGIHKYTIKSTNTFTQIKDIQMTVLTEDVSYIDLISAGSKIFDAPFERDESIVADFESHESGYYYGYDNDGFSTASTAASDAVASVSEDWANDGKYSLKVKCNGNGWMYLTSTTGLAKTYNTVSFVIKTEIAIDNWECSIFVNNSWKSFSVEHLDAGVNNVEYTFGETFTSYNGISSRAIETYGTYYIDSVALTVK
ncbi:MAG TPA: hypothetical protein DEV87_01315 [Clostridiales bacterium]|nr:hypothetical protein [Clostridiales bacterium]